MIMSSLSLQSQLLRFNTISTYVDEVIARRLPAPQSFYSNLFAVILITVVLMNARNSRVQEKLLLKEIKK